MQPRKVIPFSPVEPPRQVAGKPSIVVQIGRDTELLRLRALVMQSAGYTVRSKSPADIADEIKRADGFRIWIFCHTVEFYELGPLATAIRKERPADKLLRLSGLNDLGQVPGLFDELLDPTQGVDELLRTVAGLAKV
jgi:hypothetical protein